MTTCEATDTCDLGDVVRLEGLFTDCDDVPLDPSTVTLYLRSPTGAVSTHAYGSDLEVVKAETGRYHYPLNANIAGNWYYRWVSTGTGQAAGEKMIMVAKPKAVP